MGQDHYPNVTDIDGNRTDLHNYQQPGDVEQHITPFYPETQIGGDNLLVDSDHPSATDPRTFIFGWLKKVLGERKPEVLTEDIPAPKTQAVLPYVFAGAVVIGIYFLMRK